MLRAGFLRPRLWANMYRRVRKIDIFRVTAVEQTRAFILLHGWALWTRQQQILLHSGASGLCMYVFPNVPECI